MPRLINLHPRRGSALALGVLPFILLFLAYLFSSSLRLAENADDKLLPALSSILGTVRQYAFEEDARSGRVLLWLDTFASLKRIGMALGISAAVALLVGLAIGIIPLLRATFGSFITVISMIPPLAILPILFIVLGLDELSKIVLIIIGITPVMIRDLAQRCQELPDEQLIKAQTLGASSWQLIMRVVLPQLLPRLLGALRLSLSSAWLFLISAEAIASTEGLGYRIFLVRRYLAMDVILPYVLWITLLAFLMDWALRLLSRTLFPWTEAHG
ncbi:MAG: ABC transporter permease [Steroidobacteraceae bacterium]